MSFKALACLMFAVAFSLASLAAYPGQHVDGSLSAYASGATTDPVAVITPLSDTVSNSTQYYLDGYESYDLADDLINFTASIANYTWEVTHEETTEHLYGARVQYTFHSLGLYKIELTVTDSWGNTGVDFTAVISVDDFDYDGMPDWWELGFLGTMGEGADSDFDSDGYSNLCEWLSGTLPNVADPPPPSEGFLEEYWMYLLVAAVVLVGALVAASVFAWRRHKDRDAKKMEIALELEKTLDEE